MRSALRTYLDERATELNRIPEARKADLREIARFVQERRTADEPVDLLFVCTHNSRRSHLAHLWAQATAAYRGIDGIRTHSGGTEATAFNPRAVKAVQEAGFRVERMDDSTNPVYRVWYADTAPPMDCFSKQIAHEVNPDSGFCAVMVCSQADEACPIVPGAVSRVAIPFDDPKAADGQPDEAETYASRCAQIAREMLFVFAASREAGH